MNSTGTGSEHRWTILGDPVAKGRPRFNRVTGHAYTPGKTANWEARAVETFSCGWNGGPTEARAELEVTAVFARPKRLMRAKDPQGRVPHLSRPDADNVLKAVGDAIEKAGVLRNDSQAWRTLASKVYASKTESPRVEVLLRLDCALAGKVTP